MTRNESLLQFQERLIEVAINSPRMEAMNLLGIVYSNLKEFIEVRVVFDKDRDAILDKFFDVLAKFNSAIRYKFTNLYISQFMNSDVYSILVAEEDEQGTDLEKAKLYGHYAKSLCGNDSKMPIGFMTPDNKFVHRDLFLKTLSHFVADNKENHTYLENLIPTDTWTAISALAHLYDADPCFYFMSGDEYDVCPQVEESCLNLHRIDTVMQWCSIKENTKSDGEPDVKLSFILGDSRREEAEDFNDATVGRGFRVELDPENPNYYRVIVTNATLIGFDEIAKMIEENVKVTSEEELSPCQYQPGSINEAFIIDRTHTDHTLMRDRNVYLYRGPRKSGFLVRYLLERFGMTELLDNGFDDPEAQWSIPRIKEAASKYREFLDSHSNRDICKKTVQGFSTDREDSNKPFLAWISYMTIYRTGKLPEDTDPIDTNITDPNLRMILFFGMALGYYANFFIELRARGDERNNARIAKFLLDHDCNVTTDPINITGKKVHAKVWTFVPPYGDERIDVISTGNFCDSAQTQFADTVMIQHTKAAKMKTNIDFFWDELRIPGTVNADSYFNTERKDYLWFPNSISVRLSALINDAKINVKARPSVTPVIAIKCNHLTDTSICTKLLEAAKAGVKVILIVRSTCTMPHYINIPNLEIRSIAGKYLEHDRIFAFGFIDRDGNVVEKESFISTADLMPRNLENRIEFMMRVPESMQMLKFLIDMAETPSDPKAGFFNFKL